MAAPNAIYASRLRPVLPSNTFPNHYTMATGLYPDSHGIVNNYFYDPETGRYFVYWNNSITAGAGWWGGERERSPFGTVVKSGKRAGNLYWPGSFADIQGITPTFQLPVWNATLSAADAVDIVLGWLDTGTRRAPHFVSLYIHDVDAAGHAFGVNASETFAAIRTVDAAIARLLAGLEERGICENTNIPITA